MTRTEFWIALPDSFLSEASSLRDKTIKAGDIARACAIFRVSRIYVYNETRGGVSNDGRLLKSLLEYIETPQYLRRRLFGRTNELLFAGTLPPLRTPHHRSTAKESEVKSGDVREGVVVKKDGHLYADTGLSNLVHLDSHARNGERVTVRFITGYPNLSCEEIKPTDVKEYWGYQVRTVPTLGRFIRSMRCDSIILTSIRGKHIQTVWDAVSEKVRKSATLLVVFGAPSRGIHEILSEEGIKINQMVDFVLNMAPKQGVATVRTEEAVIITLSILNSLVHK